MENILKITEEVKDLINLNASLKHKYKDLLDIKLNIESSFFLKSKKIKEQEELITSLRSNIKGLQELIVRLNKTPEIKEVKSMENKFKEQIFDLEEYQKELLIKINRLQNKNNELSVKNIKEKIISELTNLIKNI